MAVETCITKKPKGLSFFEKYLTAWVAVCIGAGILLGKLAPGVARYLDGLSIFVNGAPVVSIPIAICLFFMMYPIMVKIDFAEVLKAGKSAKPVGLTLFVNWAIKPFTMYAIAVFFLGFVFRGLIGTEATDLVKMPFGLDLAVGATHGVGTVVLYGRRENARGPALAQLPRRLHPARHRALHGDGSRLGLPRQGQRRPHARHGGHQLAHDALALRAARRVPARRGTAAGPVAGARSSPSPSTSRCRSWPDIFRESGSSAREGRDRGSTRSSCTCSRRSRSSPCSSTLVLLFSLQGRDDHRATR